MRNTGFAALLAIFLLVFQNCGVETFFSSSNENKLTLTSGQQSGGGSYDGKPKPGDYVRTNSDNPCSPIQALITVTDVDLTLTQDNCQALNYTTSLPNPQLDYQGYNENFFIFNKSIFKKSTLLPQLVDEVFCRNFENDQGIDIVIQSLDGGSSKTASMYLGSFANGQWSRSLVNPFAVTSSDVGVQSTYQSANFQFDLAVDTQSSSGTFLGRFSAIIDGQLMTKSLACYRMSPIPTVTASVSQMVGSWLMDGAIGSAVPISANSILDSSSFLNHGTAQIVGGSMNFVAGHTGAGISFSGNENQINIAPSASITNLNAISISLWVNAFSLTTTDAMPLLTKFSAGAGGFSWAFELLPGGLPHFMAGYGASTDLKAGASGSVPLNNWQHIAMTWDGSPSSSSVVFYVDGVISTNDINAAREPMGARVDDANAALALGSFIPRLTNSLNGALDEVYLFNRVLSKEEVMALRTHGQNALK